MTNSNTPTGNDMPAPIRVLAGIFQIAGGLAVGIVGAVLKLFPVTTALGSPIMRNAHKLSYNGGANITRGIIGTFGLAGRGVQQLSQKNRKTLIEAQSDSVPPPAE